MMYMSEETVIQFGEIMKFHEKNWSAYQELLQNPYIIFVGAGLSAGIGNGSWTKLLYDVTNKVFRKKLDDNTFSIHEIVDGESEISSEDKKKANEYIRKLKTLDHSPIGEQNVKKRIELLREVTEEKRYGSIIEMLFCLIKNEEQRDYAYYEAGELLKLYGGNENYYQSVEEAIDEQRPETGKWVIAPEHAVYWLPEIVRKENALCCKVFTTNFDQIIECAVELRSTEIETSDIKVIHLHGEHGNACLALSDLYEIYQKELEKHPQRVPKVLELQEDDSRRYLFLGTSFSERHIANAITKLMSTSSSNFTIYPVPAKIDRQSNFELARKITDFKLDNLIRYPDNHKHKELVIVLRQLARDLKYGFWNNDLLMQLFFGNQGDLCKYQSINEAIKKFQNDNRELIVRIGNDVNSKEESLFLKNWTEVQYLITEINKVFYRPDWSCCFIPDAFLQVTSIARAEEMLQPLGSSLYIFLEWESHTLEGTLLENVRMQIKNYGGMYNCKLIVILLNDTDRKEVLQYFSFRYIQGNYSHSEKTLVEDIVSKVLMLNLEKLLEELMNTAVNKDISNVEDEQLQGKTFTRRKEG